MMKFLTYSSVILFSFLCYAEVVHKSEPEPIITDSLSLIPPCGAPGYPLFGCILLQGIATFVTLVCQALQTTADVSNLLACAVAPFGPLGDILSRMFNAILVGAQTISGVCPGVLSYWNTIIITRCPILAPINGLVAKLYNGKKVVSLGKN